MVNSPSVHKCYNGTLKIDEEGWNHATDIERKQASPSGLSADRGTVVKALRKMPADRMVKCKPQWKISTASREVERHLRGYECGNGGGNDPTLQAMFDQFDQQDARMRSLPELEQTWGRWPCAS